MWGAKTADDGSPRRTDAVRGPDEMPGAHGRRRVRRRGDGPRRPGVCASFSERPCAAGKVRVCRTRPLPGRVGAAFRSRRVLAEAARETGASVTAVYLPAADEPVLWLAVLGGLPWEIALGGRAGRDLRQGPVAGGRHPGGARRVLHRHRRTRRRCRTAHRPAGHRGRTDPGRPRAARRPLDRALARRLARGAPGASRPARQRRRSPPKQSTRAAESGGRMPHGAPRRAHL